MKKRFRLTVSLFLLAAATYGGHASAQAVPANGHADMRPELAITYTYIRSNARPGGCGCFSLNGGTGSLALPLGLSRFSFLASLTDANVRDISNSGAGFNLSLYTAGARYRLRLGTSGWSPFGQVQVGIAHAIGEVIQGQYSATPNGRAALTTVLGGGLDRRVSRTLSLRLVEADYLMTRFDNSGNNRQNNLDLSSGVVFRFGSVGQSQ